MTIEWKPVAAICLAFLWACQGTVTGLMTDDGQDAAPADGGASAGGQDAGTADASETSPDAGAPSGARSAGCGVAQEAGFRCLDLSFEGATRNWCINIPESYDPTHAYDLVIGLHGCGGRNRNVHKHRAPMEANGENEFLFIYPQALESCWDYQSTPSEGNDMSFIAHMVGLAQGMTCLNTERSFVHGMSSGGNMSPAVARAGLAIAFASVAGGGATAKSTPAWYYAGTTDSYYASISHGVQQQLSVNKCGSSPVSKPIEGTPCVRYQACDAAFTYCEDARGHVWPSEDWAQGGILDFFRAVP